MCSYLPQWGFHSSWISADLRKSWTTHATSTSTQRRGSRLECGGSCVDSLCVHLSAWTKTCCTFDTGGFWASGAALDSCSNRRTTQKPTVCLKRQSYLFVMLSFVPSLSLFLLGIQSPPANGRRPRGKALSGTGSLWETAILLLSISMETREPGGMRVPR